MCIRDRYQRRVHGLLNELLEELIKTVNKGILKEGIPLPNSKLFEFDNVEQTIMQHYVALCGTLKPKFSRLLPQQLYILSLIHISEPTRPLYISYAVFCLKKKKKPNDSLAH
eukprot:TRINITY_DN12664_c0_g1_i4.p2 TRINITY_DN12664_c0_g1~~TRINITY_DN12664_c0_g1_i4.p2  ORF type:complete len:112 (-),score=26.06 TRINITY_DN12664_c0_g1_i4:32-367(-)